MWIKNRYQIEEASVIAGIEQKIFLEWIENQWILPVEAAGLELDHEDIARAKLIQNLKKDFEVNDAGISIVLHLLDQVYYLHNRIGKL